MGAAVVAVNTLNRENIQVSWSGSMLSNFTYGTGTNAQTRFYQIQLQYAVGDTSQFTDVPGSVFDCNSDSVTYKLANTTEIIPAVSLPVECNNQPLVLLRWMYRKSNSGSNQRPKLAFDDITVTSSIYTGVTNKAESIHSLNVFPNPSVDHQLTINKLVTAQVYNTIGSLVYSMQNSNKVDLSNQPAGVYFIKTNKGEVEKIILK